MKTYTTTMKFQFPGHLLSSKYCDVTLSTLDGAGRVLPAHRLVLAAASVKLEKLFDSAGEGSGPVVVRNIRFEVLKKIKEMIYSGKVEVEEADIEDFQDGVDMLRVSVSELGDQIALHRVTSRNVREEFRNSSHPSPLANVSFNNNSAETSIKLVADINSSVVLPKNLEETAQANQDHVDGEQSKAIPFHTGSDVSSAGGSYKDKKIPKKFSNPYFPANGFSSTDSEPETDETKSSSEQKMKKFTNKSISDITEKIRFPCHVCPSKFTVRRNLVRHVKSAHEQIRIPCHLCPKKFTEERNLVRHIKSVHEQIRIRISCHQCPSKFTARRNLVKHMKTVHEQIRYPCHLCPSKFTEKGSLGRHIKSVHEQIRISCHLCPSKFTEKRRLVRHIKSVHEQF